MNLISVGYGKMNFSETSLSIATFKMEKPWIREFPSKSHKKRNTHVIDVSKYPVINGRMFLDTLDIPDNTLLVLQVSKRYRSVGSADGAIFFQVNSQGGLIHVNVNTIADPSSLLQTNTFCALVANGYILSDEEILQLGYEPNNRYLDTYRHQDELDELFDLRQITSEAAPRPQPLILKTISGTEKVIHVPVVRRHIRVKR